MPDQNTGKSQASDAMRAAGNLAPVALDLAQGATATQAATNALKGAVLDKLLGPTAVFAGGMVGVLRTMKAIVDQSGILERGLKRIADVQQIQGRFETLLKSVEKAKDRMEELYKFSNRAPFNFGDIAEANRLLQALTRGALANAKGMEMVGDVAAATGENISTVAERFGKLYAALRSGRSLDKVLFQLQMSGAVTEELASALETAEATGASFADKWALVTEVMKRSEGAMASEMATMKGLEAAIKNASAAFDQAFSEPFAKSQQTAMQNTLDATRNLTPLVAQMGQDLAPIFRAFSNVKNSIFEATFATRGFADALGIAWQFARAMAVAVAAGSLANLARGGGGLLRSIGANANSARVSQQSSTVQQGLTRSKELGTQASSAFAEAAFGTAIALKAQSIWIALSSRAMGLHAVAVRLATMEVGKFNLAKYASVVATGLLGGALGLLRTGFNMVATAATAATGAMVAHPITAIALAAGAAATAFMTWASSMEKAQKSYMDFIGSIAGRGNDLDRFAREVKDMDGYAKSSADTAEEQKDLIQKIRELGSDPTAYDYAVGLNGQVTGTGRVLNPKESADWMNKREELNKRLRNSRARQAALDARVGSLAPGSAAAADIAARAEAEMRAAEARQNERMARTSDLNRLSMLEARIQRNQALVALGQRIEEGRNDPAKFRNNPTKLMQATQQIEAIRAAGGTPPAYMLARQAELNQYANTWRDRRGQIDSDQTELARLTTAIRSSFGEALGTNLMNRRLAAGDGAGAQGFSDAMARLRLQEQYAQLGLSPKQANEAFNASIAAQVASESPRVVADSLASIGGGGGTYAGSMDLAQRQLAEATAMRELLKQIAINTGLKPDANTLR